MLSDLSRVKVRPMPGHLWCQKLPTVQSVDIEGLGTVNAAAITGSGLVLVSDKDHISDMVRATLIVVRSLGADPPAPRHWHTYCNGREVTWPCGTWAEQKIGIGTVIAVRAVAGIDQGRDTEFMDIRYDEVAAIGAPLDEPDDAPAMYPGPGWVMIEVEKEDTDTSDGGIYIGENRADVFRNVGLVWGRVIAVPRGWKESVQVGTRVGVPRWAGTEYIEFDGGIRVVPWQDVLVYSDGG